MERNEILEKIIEIASDVLGTNPDVNEQTTFDDWMPTPLIAFSL